MTFSFLHSMSSNATLFTDALGGSGLVPERHEVRQDLLEKVTARGQIDAALEAEIEAAIRDAGKDVDRVLLTCSSLSPVADRLKGEGVPVERTDGLLAEAVFRDAMQSRADASVAVLVVAPSTVDATGGLFERCRKQMGAQSVALGVILLPNVWDLFLSGDLEGYRAALAKEIDQYLEGNATISHVALGQASMAPALALCQSSKRTAVWTIPDATRAFLAGLADTAA